MSMDPPMVDFEMLGKAAPAMVEVIRDCFNQHPDMKVLPDPKPGYLRSILPSEAPQEGSTV